VKLSLKSQAAHGVRPHISLRRRLAYSSTVIVATLLALELGVRAVNRLRFGSWSQLATSDAALYIEHPILGRILRPGSHADYEGHEVRINSLGYRGASMQLQKPPGTIRIACIGGSTTFDPKVSRDELAWPSQLATLLQGRHGVKNVEVINAATEDFSLPRSLMDLAMRTVDLQPDWVICYSGISDLGNCDHADHQVGQWQNASVPHVETPFWKEMLAYSALYRAMADHVQHSRQEKYGNLEGRFIERQDAPDPRGIAAFERNLKTLVGICRAHGIRLALVTIRTAYAPMQPMDVQNALAQGDLMEHPTLSLTGHYRGYEAINNIIRKTAATYRLALIDQATVLPAGDMHFADSVHFNDAGSAALAFLAADQMAPYLKPRPVEVAISQAPATRTALQSQPE
jgi:lysophospholipase L1-like esterase